MAFKFNQLKLVINIQPKGKINKSFYTTGHLENFVYRCEVITVHSFKATYNWTEQSVSDLCEKLCYMNKQKPLSMSIVCTSYVWIHKTYVLLKTYVPVSKITWWRKSSISLIQRNWNPSFYNCVRLFCAKDYGKVILHNTEQLLMII